MWLVNFLPVSCNIGCCSYSSLMISSPKYTLHVAINGMNAAVAWDGRLSGDFGYFAHENLPFQCRSHVINWNMYNWSGQEIMTLPYYSIVNNQIKAALLLLSGCMVCMPHTGTACRSPAVRVILPPNSHPTQTQWPTLFSHTRVATIASTWHQKGRWLHPKSHASLSGSV